MKRLLCFCLLCCLVSFSPKQQIWVAVGDSITYLNDHLDETGNRVKKGYLTRVTGVLPNIHYINQGHNGWTSGDIADSIQTLGIPEADIYTIFLGTNDWWQGRPLGTLSDYKNNNGNSTVYGSFRIIINKLHSLNKAARIILITPMQRTDFVYLTNFANNAWGSYKDRKGQSLSSFATTVDSIASYENIDVIDLYHNSNMTIPKLVKFKRLKDTVTGAYKNYEYPAYTHIPFHDKQDDYPYPPDAVGYTYDGLHPSDEGNKVIAEKIIALLKRSKISE